MEQDLLPDGGLVEDHELPSQSPGTVFGVAETHDVHGRTGGCTERTPPAVGTVERPAQRGTRGRALVGEPDLVVDRERGVRERGANAEPELVGVGPASMTNLTL